jgi:uncharacterized protein
MRLSLDHHDGYLIRGYDTGMLLINDINIDASVLVTPTELRRWTPQRFEQLCAEHFRELLALEPELVLFGSGARQRFPSPSLTAGLLEAGLGVETMDTAAACRTYNILMAEGRRVAAALLLIEEPR